MVRWTEDDLANFKQNSGRPIAPASIAEMAKNKRLAKLQAVANAQEASGKVTVKRAHKYGAEPVTVDGIRFDSKLEARRYCELVLLQKAGEIAFFLRQVPIHLPGGVTYRIDFMILRPMLGAKVLGCYLISFEDCKGHDTQAGKNKIKQAEALYGIKVELVRKASKGRVP